MTREDPEIAHHVPAGRRYRGDETEHQVFGRKHDGARAVFPDALERELERAIGARGEPVLRDGRACHVTAEPLELASVTAVDPLTACTLTPRTSATGSAGSSVGSLGSTEATRR